MYKELHKDLGEFLMMQANVYVKLDENNIRTPEDIEELNGFLETFADFYTRTMSNIDKAYGVVTALPTVVEGDIYEHKTQPVGPLMRSTDGSTLRDHMYTEIRTNPSRNEQTSSMSNTGMSTQSITSPTMFQFNFHRSIFYSPGRSRLC